MKYKHIHKRKTREAAAIQQLKFLALVIDLHTFRLCEKDDWSWFSLKHTAHVQLSFACEKNCHPQWQNCSCVLVAFAVLLTCFHLSGAFSPRCITTMNNTHSCMMTWFNHLDINECGSGNGGCEQMCTNTNGGYLCECRAGFKRKSNNPYGCEGSCVYNFHLGRLLIERKSKCGKTSGIFHNHHSNLLQFSPAPVGPID